jgi:hypothetical protein
MTSYRPLPSQHHQRGVTRALVIIAALGMCVTGGLFSSKAVAGEITDLFWQLGSGNIGIDWYDGAALPGANEFHLMERFTTFAPGEILGEGDVVSFSQFDRGAPASPVRLFLVKEVFNDTDFSWTGFFIEVLGPDDRPQPVFRDFGIMFPSSDMYSTVTGDGPNGPADPDGTDNANILFFSGGKVDIGETVNFYLLIEVTPGSANGNQLQFKLRQTPVPEPTTLALLTLAAPWLLRRR